MLHGRHKEQTENIKLSKLQREVEDKRTAILIEMKSHVNELDNKIDKKVEKLARKYFPGFENEKKTWNSNKPDKIQNSLNEEMNKEK